MEIDNDDNSKIQANEDALGDGGVPSKRKSKQVFESSKKKSSKKKK